MARVVLDPEEVNQQRVVTLTNGETVALDEQISRRILDRVAEQLHVFRSAYAHALEDEHLFDDVAAGRRAIEDVAPLHLRVAQLQTVVRTSHRRAPKDLDPRLLLQTRTWVSSSGATRELATMTPSHRRNLLGWLERNADDLQNAFADADLTAEERNAIVPATPWIKGTPLYRRLEELIASETERDRARDKARQIARSVEFERSGEWPDES